jgi:hypothetical protein
MKQHEIKGEEKISPDVFYEFFPEHETPKNLDDFFQYFLSIVQIRFSLTREKTSSGICEEYFTDQLRKINSARDFLYQEIQNFGIVPPNRYSIIERHCLLHNELVPSRDNDYVLFDLWFQKEYRKMLS